MFTKLRQCWKIRRKCWTKRRFTRSFSKLKSTINLRKERRLKTSCTSGEFRYSIASNSGLEKVIKWARCHKPISRRNLLRSCRARNWGKYPAVTPSSAAASQWGSQMTCGLIQREAARKATLMAPLSMIRKDRLSRMIATASRLSFRSLFRGKKRTILRYGRGRYLPEVCLFSLQVISRASIWPIIIMIWILIHFKLDWASAAIPWTSTRRYQLILTKKIERIKHWTIITGWSQKDTDKISIKLQNKKPVMASTKIEN